MENVQEYCRGGVIAEFHILEGTMLSPELFTPGTAQYVEGPCCRLDDHDIKVLNERRKYANELRELGITLGLLPYYFEPKKRERLTRRLKHIEGVDS